MAFSKAFEAALIAFFILINIEIRRPTTEINGALFIQCH
jgi:hypothetical protein